ncbi:GAP family protein [Rhodococcus sp. HNM0569]|uniref:GAP family protein n=1 Tax=Rhodococcus sp. HNM0569 TaxID=2716340 RepID=UPI00146B515F|nr:GAP family protein [Rhodococcus sp. HNM0569]NLU84693.1 GAP family protein [Rhodococcus sp. HNM0569]
MGAVIGDLLPLAIGVAVSPIPIIAAILMLLSTHAGTTSVGFAAGWLVGIVVATVVFVLLGGVVDSSGEPSAASWIRIVLGVLLLTLGVRKWLARNEPHETPKWMTAIDGMTAVKGAGLGFGLAAVNPKNLLMCAGAGVTIGSAALSGGAVAVAVALFSVLAAITVVVPVVGYLVAADRLRRPLSELKEWLQDNNTAVMGVLVLVIGVMLVGKGIGGLS